MIYFVIILLILIGIIRFDISGCKRSRIKYFWFLVIMLILISGFSYRLGDDGMVYYKEYKTYVDIFNLDAKYLELYSVTRLPGWMILTSITKTVIDDYWFFKLIHAIIVNGLFAYGLVKCTKYIYTALLFYFVLIYFNFNFQVLRESLAVAILMYSLPFFFSKQWIKYYTCCLIALTFHESSIFSMLIPAFLLWDKSKIFKYTYLTMLVVILISANALRTYILQIIPELGIFTDRVSTYAQTFNEEYEFTNYWNFVLNVLLPIYVIRNFEKKNIFIKYSHFILAATFVYTLSLFIPVAYRFVNYYLIFNFLAIILFIDKILLKNIKRHCSLFIMCCFVFIIFKARMYLLPVRDTGIATYHQYYPYASIFDKTKDPQREKLFKALGH